MNYFPLAIVSALFCAVVISGKTLQPLPETKFGLLFDDHELNTNSFEKLKCIADVSAATLKDNPLVEEVQRLEKSKETERLKSLEAYNTCLNLDNLEHRKKCIHGILSAAYDLSHEIQHKIHDINHDIRKLVDKVVQKQCDNFEPMAQTTEIPANTETVISAESTTAASIGTSTVAPIGTSTVASIGTSTIASIGTSTVASTGSTTVSSTEFPSDTTIVTPTVVPIVATNATAPPKIGFWGRLGSKVSDWLSTV